MGWRWVDILVLLSVVVPVVVVVAVPCVGHLKYKPTTWHQTDLSKLVEVPLTPINTPLMVKVDTPHSFCSSPLVKVLV
jgi:hypothetical protein